MKTDNLVQLGFMAVIGYIIIKALPSLQKGKDEAENTLAKWWLALFPNPPSMVLLGNVVMPDGSLIPLNNIPPKQDSAGNVYVTYNSHYYQLSPSDANGNWPATLVG